MTNLPARAQVVIIGGGVIGCSVAYHLTHLGWRDVVVLEQGSLSCGTTWHAAGLVGQLRATEASTRLVRYSTELYGKLEAETGLGTGYRVCGGLTVARTPARMVQLRRTVASAAAYDLECELLTPAQAGSAILLRTEDLVGAIWLPGDGRANPTDLTQSLVKVRGLAARVLERCGPGGPHRRWPGGGVRTDQGDIDADVVVNCAGQWARRWRPGGVTVPLHSAEHFYVVTDQIEGVHQGLPILRDPDGYTYVKEEVGGLLVGGFEPVAKPWVSPDEIPYPFEFQLLEEDWEHFEILMSAAVHRLPVLGRTGIRKFYNGPESFTPDNQFLLGEAPELPGFFVAAGFNSVGIASAGGAGRALAEWIVAGEPTMDLVSADIRRFGPLQGNNTWLRARVGEVLGLHYAIPWPNRELESARGQRRSPIHHLLETQNACFGARNGWERANVFAPSGIRAEIGYSWERPDWVDWCVAEQRGCAEGVAIFDQTFSKYRHRPGRRAGAAVVAPMSRCSSGKRYTALLNAGGTYEADVTVTRTGAQEFVARARRRGARPRLVAPTRPVGANAHIVDVPSGRRLWGHGSALTRTAVAADANRPLEFPFATSKEMFLGAAIVRATRITYVGELGYEISVPVEQAVGVYEELFRAGADLGVTPAGYYAIEAMRLEKGYRAFGRELTPEVDPMGAGLTFACKLAGEVDFVGRAAVAQAKRVGPARRIVSIVVADPLAYLWGGELVRREGVAVGQVTSAAWGARLGTGVGLALVGDRATGSATTDWLRSGAWDVDLAGRTVSVSVRLRAPYDPDNTRVRC